MDRSNPQPKGFRKALQLLREETTGFHLRLIALNTVAGFLPRYQAPHTRARLFSFAGFQIGDGATLGSIPRITGGPNLFSNLSLGGESSIAVDCLLDLSDRITIGRRVTIGPGVMILTSTHELDIREHRAGPVQLSPVSIGDGAWLGARCVVLPGVTVGAGAIVNVGSVVNKDVAPHTRVGGIPATLIEVLANPAQNST